MNDPVQLGFVAGEQDIREAGFGSYLWRDQSTFGQDRLDKVISDLAFIRHRCRLRLADKCIGGNFDGMNQERGWLGAESMLGAKEHSDSRGVANAHVVDRDGNVK